MIRCDSEADSIVWMKEDDDAQAVCLFMVLIALKCDTFQSFFMLGLREKNALSLMTRGIFVGTGSQNV